MFPETRRRLLLNLLLRQLFVPQALPELSIRLVSKANRSISQHLRVPPLRMMATEHDHAL